MGPSVTLLMFNTQYNDQDKIEFVNLNNINEYKLKRCQDNGNLDFLYPYIYTENQKHIFF